MVLAAEANICSSISDPIDLQIGASKAKNYQEVDFEVRSPGDLPKTAQKGAKRCSTLKSFVEQNFVQQKIELMGIV